jgi:NAD(P)-dependent dehydrogenase (short-subunit alcohol dehydrogenase family)
VGRLEGKVAIITGASSGIGKASAVIFAREGAKVVVVCRTATAGEETVGEIKEAGGEAIYVGADVSKTEDVQRMIKTTVYAYGRLDILFNNAGILLPYGPIQECPEEAFDETIAINLKGVWLGMKYAIPEMLKTGGGSIINTSSAVAALGVSGASCYSASKGGLNAMSRAMAVEVAANNIRVNVIQPAIIATPMLASMPLDQREALIKKSRPRGKAGTAEEVAYAALFLASDEASDITGTVIAIDGGATAKHP